jgi:uncharacterized protein (TIGR02145 family)
MNNSTSEKAQGICPNGWHIPSDGEWTILGNFLGGNAVAGGKMKQTGTDDWNAPNSGATNSSGFTALPAGEWEGDHFQLLHQYAVMWSSSQTSNEWAFYRYLAFDDAELHPFNFNKNFGYSVRCIQDEQTSTNDIIKPRINLFPNPCSNELCITQSENYTGKTTVVIINQTGQEVKKFRLADETHSVNLEFLPSGLYLCMIVNDSFSYQQKIIKQ